MLDNQNTVQQLINEVNLLRTQLDAITNSVSVIVRSDALASEIIHRTNADDALDGRINQEISDRTNADDALDGRINQEIINRANADDALTDELDAVRERLIANGIGVDLLATNNATGLDFNDDQFKVPGVWYFDHAINTSTENTAGIITVKKVGDKAFQHEILENGKVANRVFTGVTWLSWVYQTGAIQGVVSFIPVDDYADLNDFNTVGYFSFRASDNLLHAPPTQGIESDYEMQVMTTTDSYTIQIVNNITTNTCFVRAKLVNLQWPDTWLLTPPIEHIVTNANVDGIRSEGVYLCIENTLNNDLYPIFILYVKNSDTLQTVAQVSSMIGINRIKYRILVDNGINGSGFGSWQGRWSWTQDNRKGIIYYFFHHSEINRLVDYIQIESQNYYHNWRDSLEAIEYAGGFMLRNYNLDNAIDEGLYIFTLNDDIANIPSVFTDENHFLFLIVINRGIDLAQIIFQGYSEDEASDMYVRIRPYTGQFGYGTLSDWELVP